MSLKDRRLRLAQGEFLRLPVIQSLADVVRLGHLGRKNEGCQLAEIWRWRGGM